MSSSPISSPISSPRRRASSRVTQVTEIPTPRKKASLHQYNHAVNGNGINVVNNNGNKSSNGNNSNDNNNNNNKNSNIHNANTNTNTTLSAVDDESTFERLLTTYVCEPIVRLIPVWVKPNTISIVNNVVNWLQLVLAFWAVMVDHPVDTWIFSDQIKEETYQARFYALLIRLFTSFCVFSSMVFDCLDGMHARRTKQTSKLGEVMDHALDSANIPIMAVAFLVSMSGDRLSIATAVIASGSVFNSQLVVYRHCGKMIKPPTNGPEAQMLLAIGEAVISTLLFLHGRESYLMTQVVFWFCFVGNIIQLRNTFYFWSYLNWQIAYDHAVFCFLTSALGVIYGFNLISSLVFTIASIWVAFRLSGVYVMFIVANKHRAADERHQEKSALQSSFSSLYSGIDWNVLWGVVLLTCVPLYMIYYHSLSHFQDSITLDQTSTTLSSTQIFLFTPTYQYYLLLVFCLHMIFVSLHDLKKCLPFLLPAHLVNTPLLRLFF